MPIRAFRRFYELPINHPALIMVIALVAITLVTAPTVWAQGSSPNEQLLKLVPDPLPTSAVSKEPATFYVSENLYKYMDGGADIFLLYDFQTLLHQEFNAKEIDVTVDIFDMGSADNAFGIYAAERSPSYHFVSLGAEGYQDEGIVNFFQGQYYIKLAGFGAGANTVLDDFAQRIAKRIGAAPQLPALLEQLPRQNRKPHSEQYMPKDPMGHAFLSPAYAVSYAIGDQECKLLVSVAKDEAGARERLKLLDQHFRTTGKSSPAPEIGEGAIRADNSFEGTLLAQVKGHYLVLLSNPAPGSEQLAKDAIASLH